MKTFIPVIALVFIALLPACNKDDSKLPTAMTVKVNGDTAFVTTNVTTNARTANLLYITGTSTDGNQKVELGLSKYAGSIGTFVIDRRGLDGSTGYYRNSGTITEAQNGSIKVTDVSAGVIKGTFDLYYQSTRIVGSFTAPQK